MHAKLPAALCSAAKLILGINKRGVHFFRCVQKLFLPQNTLVTAVVCGHTFVLQMPLQHLQFAIPPNPVFLSCKHPCYLPGSLPDPCAFFLPSAAPSTTQQPALFATSLPVF